MYDCIISNLLSICVFQSLERELKDAKASLQALSSEKKQLLEDADELMARKAGLEVSVGDLDARVVEEKVTKVCVHTRH